MPVPRLHVVTDDHVVASEGFADSARRLVEAHGPALAFHLRGPRTSAIRLLDLAEGLAAASRDAGAVFLVNDCADVALAAAADGVQLGRRSLPVAAARSIREDWLIGASVHDAAEARGASGADFLLLGAIWETASHPGREGSGTGVVARVSERVRVPVIAIGGVTPARARAALEAGARGVAVIRGIWQSADPVTAAGEYLDSVREGAGEGR